MSDETNRPTATTPENPPSDGAAPDITPGFPPGVTPGIVQRPGPSAADWVFLGVVAVASAGLDLWSKAWAMRSLSAASSAPPPLCMPPPGATHYFPQRRSLHEVVLLRDYLALHYAENCGGAWGLLHGASEALRRPFFLLVTVGAIAFIVHLYRGLERGQVAMKWALPLVLGGAIGNLVNRVRLGYVVDFIDAHWHERAHWPTFNVADIAITVGIGLMLIEYIVGPRKVPAEGTPPTPGALPASPAVQPPAVL